MKFKKALIFIGALLVAAGATGIIAGAFATSAMIVQFGVRALSALGILSYVAVGLGAGVACAGIIPPIVRASKRKKEERLLTERKRSELMEQSEYAKDSLNPEKTRARLEQLKEHNEKLSNLMDICLRQLYRIDTYQERQNSLLEANEAIYLEDTKLVLEESERRMCHNFRNIINCCILIENTDGGTEELDGNIIDEALTANEEELAEVSTLLKYSVAYINNYNSNGVKDRSELDAWLKIMKSSVGDRK